MTVQPYESEADREARRKAEEEKRRREEEAKGSNDKFRALDVSRDKAESGGQMRRGGRSAVFHGALLPSGCIWFHFIPIAADEVNINMRIVVLPCRRLLEMVDVHRDHPLCKSLRFHDFAGLPPFSFIERTCRRSLSGFQDMMHGTLEVKQDALTADAVKKPEWMDEVAAEDMTEEQKKVGKQTSRCVGWPKFGRNSQP